MKYINLVIFSSFVFCMLISCNGTKQVDVSDINVDVEIINFFKELNSIDSSNVEDVKSDMYTKYPSFMRAYCGGILGIGEENTPVQSSKLLQFVHYEANFDIADTVSKVFPNFNTEREELTEAFKHYRFYFPDNSLPSKLFVINSGFNNAISIDSTWVSVSIEKYLGVDCKFYEDLGTPKYLRKGMIKDKFVPDVMRGLAMTDFPQGQKNQDVINSMVNVGKIKYFVKQMIPSLSDTLLFDYSAEQLKWAETNEESAWSAMVEWKHVYDTNHMNIRKYTGQSPYTSFFGTESAPRMGEYLGYKIVSSYAKNNPQLSLADIMYNTDGRDVLQKSGYRP